MECAVCGRKLSQKEYETTVRNCEIGLVCKPCYPAYKVTRDKLREYYNKSLQKSLSQVSV